ncbi:hypothetical protein ACOMHN_021719 [Nucella lapillus]
MERRQWASPARHYSFFGRGCVACGSTPRHTYKLDSLLSENSVKTSPVCSACVPLQSKVGAVGTNPQTQTQQHNQQFTVNILAKSQKPSQIWQHNQDTAPCSLRSPTCGQPPVRPPACGSQPAVSNLRSSTCPVSNLRSTTC